MHRISLLPLALTAAVLLAGCTPRPRATDGPPPCYAWDFVERCDGWMTPAFSDIRRLNRLGPERYDLYLDPDGYYEKYVGGRLVGAGEFWIGCAATGNCLDDELVFVSDTGREWSLWLRDVRCADPYPAPAPLPVDPDWPPIVLPGSPTPPPVKDEPERGVTKQPPRRDREGERPPVRRKGVRRSERQTKEPATAEPDTSRVKEPTGRSPQGSGRDR